MPGSFSILFAVLIAVPGILIPLLVLGRMYRVLVDERRNASEKLFAGGTMIGMLLLMGFAIYAAREASALLSSLAAMSG